VRLRKQLVEDHRGRIHSQDVALEGRSERISLTFFNAALVRR